MSRRRPVRDWLERHKRISAHFTTTWTKIADEIRPHANATPVEPVPGRTGRAKDAAQQGRFSR